MTTLLCNHHMGIITYDANGNQVIIGGHGQSIEASRLVAASVSPPASSQSIVAQPTSTTQTNKKDVKGDAAKPLAGTVQTSTGVSSVPLTSSQLNMSPAIRQLIADGVLTIAG